MRRGQTGFDVIEIEVETDVAVKISVARVAGITAFAAPDLRGGMAVAPERGDAVRREDGREDAVARTRSRVQNAVRVHDEPADVRLLQNGVHALDVGAFRQPDAARVAAEPLVVVVARGEDLRAERRRMFGEQRQQRVRGGAGDDFQNAGVLEFAERADEVAVAAEISFQDAGEPAVIIPGERLKPAVPARAFNFLFGQRDQIFQPARVTVAEQRGVQHRAKRGREREREPRGHAVALPAVEHLEQRHVGFGDGFVKPAFFEKRFVLGMPHERQVRVQHEGKIGGRFQKTEFRSQKFPRRRFLPSRRSAARRVCG